MTRHYMTIDVEDWYHAIPQTRWAASQARVESVTDWILDQLRMRGITGTFFVLGYIAERHPDMVYRIAEAGHEIGIHGYDHQSAREKTILEFDRDISNAVRAVRQVVGYSPNIYRAPAFSLNIDSTAAWEVLADNGVAYDSSIYKSIAHKNRKIPDVPFDIELPSGRIITELPLIPGKWMGVTVPSNGGGYFRILPSAFTFNYFNRSSRSQIFYIHPRDLDPGLPRIEELGWISDRKVHIGLRSVRQKFCKLLDQVKFSPLLKDLHQRDLKKICVEEIQLV